MARQQTPKATLAEILQHARQQTSQTTAEYVCQVQITGLRNPADCITLSCGGKKCMKGVNIEDNEMWCDGCENPVLFPRARFTIQLEVSDNTAHAVIVCMDDTAEVLTKTTAGSIITAQSGVSNRYSVYDTTMDDRFTPILITDHDGSLTTIPNCIHSLFGTTMTIEVDTSTYYDHGNFEAINCKKILDTTTIGELIGSSSAVRANDKGKHVLTIPTPVKNTETIPKLWPFADGYESDETVTSPAISRDS